MSPAEPKCLFCGDVEFAEVHEAWGHSVMFETCCEGLQEELNRELAADVDGSRGRSGAQWIRDLIESGLGRRPRRMFDAGLELQIDYGISFDPIEFSDAAKFVEDHHEHCDAPRGWKFGFSIWNGATQLGVITVGRPVARMIDRRRDTLEVNRLCLDRTLPDGLRWNACSQAYTEAARRTERMGYSKIITYTRDDEAGTSLKACGWIPDAVVEARSWAHSRPDRSEKNIAGRTRWTRDLKPTKQAVETLRAWYAARDAKKAMKARAAARNGQTGVTLNLLHEGLGAS